MASLFDRVQQFFRDEGWPAEVVEDATLKLDWRGESAEWICIARVREAFGQLMFYSLAPFTVPDGDRPRVAELLMRLNGRLVAGNFELDLGDGELRFRTSVDLGPETERNADEADDVPRLLGQLVGSNTQIMDHYLPAVIAVLSGEPPADACAHVDRALS